jgi:hypothetical protein
VGFASGPQWRRLPQHPLFLWLISCFFASYPEIYYEDDDASIFVLIIAVLGFPGVFLA